MGRKGPSLMQPSRKDGSPGGDPISNRIKNDRRGLSYLPPNPVLWENGLTFRKSQSSRDIW